MTKLWMIRAEGGTLVEPFLTHKLVAICLGEPRQWRRPVDLQALKAHAGIYHRRLTAFGRTIAAKQMRYVLDEMSDGHWAVTYDPKQRRYWLGPITSDYRYRPKVPLPLSPEKYPYAHTRDVNWKCSVLRDSLSERARAHLAQPVTIFPIEPEVASELLRKARA